MSCMHIMAKIIDIVVINSYCDPKTKLLFSVWERALALKRRSSVVQHANQKAFCFAGPCALWSVWLLSGVQAVSRHRH